MGSIDDLHKLADLKKQGVVTEEEFEEQRRRIMADIKTGPRTPAWAFWRSPTAYMLAAAGTILYFAAKLVIGDAAKLPECGDEQVRSKVVETINERLRNTPLLSAILGGTRLISVDGAEEIHADPIIRACEAKTRTNKGVGVIGYTIEWTSKEDLKYSIQIEGVDVLRARYAKPEAQATVSPQPSVVDNEAQSEQPSSSQMPPQLHSDDPQPKAALSLSAEHTRCMRSAESDHQVSQCLDAEMRHQDARLRAAYSAAISNVGDKVALTETQRQWELQLDRECGAEARGDSPDAIKANQCIAAKTALRANELEASK